MIIVWQSGARAPGWTVLGGGVRVFNMAHGTSAQIVPTGASILRTRFVPERDRTLVLERERTQYVTKTRTRVVTLH